MTEEDLKDLKEVQEIVREHPVIREFLLHRLGNHMQGIQGFLELIDKPETTESQRQNYVAKGIMGCKNVFTFLRDCGVEHEYKLDTGFKL